MSLTSDRRLALALALAFAAGVAIRAAYVVLETSFDLFVLSFTGGDAVFYTEIARNIANGQGMSAFGRPTAFVVPGYPLFLAGLIRLGADPLAVGLVQALVGGVTGILAALTTLELARAVAMPPQIGRAVALGSGTVAAIYPHLIFWTGYVITETLFVCLVAAALYATVRAHRTRSWEWALAAGFASSAAALTRPPFLAVGLTLAVWLLWSSPPGKAEVRRTGKVLAGLFALALLVPMGAWTARNAAVMGAPILTSTGSGFVFYQGNSPGATGGSRGYVDDHDFRLPAEPPPGGEVERDRYFLRHAVDHIVADPIATIQRWPAKIVNMWRPTYEGSSPRNVVVMLGSYLPVLVAGLAGVLLLLARAGMRSSAAVPALALAVWFAVHVAATGMIRFRLAGELVLIEAAPFGVLAAINEFQRRRSRS